MKRMMIT